MLLNESEIKALIEGVWSGKYDQTKLPYWLFSLLSDNFEKAAVEGWGNTLGQGVKDIKLELSMQNNLYFFAAHKTAHELKDLQQIMLISKNKFDFVQNALKIDEKYNKFWYETEYNVTKRIARSGREWQRIENSKEDYPYLEFQAVNDANTRKSHAALDGIIRRVDDDFWKKYFPPLDWNCRCTTERKESGKQTVLTGKDLPDVEPQFAERVTDSKKIWHESHPYFSGLSKKTVSKIDTFVELKKDEKNGK